MGQLWTCIFTCDLFSALEDEIRVGLKLVVTEPNLIKKAKFVTDIDDVQFFWCIIAVIQFIVQFPRL